MLEKASRESKMSKLVQTTSQKAKKLLGRPPKFKEPRRPITITLPERTLTFLDAINPDKALSIVKAVDFVMSTKEKLQVPVQTVEVCPGQSLIVIGPSLALKKIPWLRLVEIVPTRFLLSIPSGTPVEALELAILDLHDSLPPNDSYERSLLTNLRKKLSTVRKGQKLSKAEILFVASE